MLSSLFIGSAIFTKISFYFFLLFRARVKWLFTDGPVVYWARYLHMFYLDLEGAISSHRICIATSLVIRHHANSQNYDSIIEKLLAETNAKGKKKKKYIYIYSI